MTRHITVCPDCDGAGLHKRECALYVDRQTVAKVTANRSGPWPTEAQVRRHLPTLGWVNVERLRPRLTVKGGAAPTMAALHQRLVAMSHAGLVIYDPVRGKATRPPTDAAGVQA